jgi:predicted O-methyltransferase YrrM
VPAAAPVVHLPAAPCRDLLAARYRELQEELAALVAREPAPYPREERIRQAQEGSIKLHDAILLAELLAAHPPGRILEIGGFIGFSTRWLLETSGARVVSIDPGIRHRLFDRPDEIRRRFNAHFLPSRLVVKRGFFSRRLGGDWYYDYEHYKPVLSRAEVDALMDSTPVLDCESLGERGFDFIFIDGDHNELAILDIFFDALPLLGGSGCIAFQDALTWPDVGRALARIALEYGGLGSVEVLGRELQGCDCNGIGVYRLG